MFYAGLIQLYNQNPPWIRTAHFDMGFTVDTQQKHLTQSSKDFYNPLLKTDNNIHIDFLENKN